MNNRQSLSFGSFASNTKNLQALQVLSNKLRAEKAKKALEETAQTIGANLSDSNEFKIVQVVSNKPEFLGYSLDELHKMICG